MQNKVKIDKKAYCTCKLFLVIRKKIVLHVQIFLVLLIRSIDLGAIFVAVPF